jgi:hypothetical protein
MGFQDVLNKLYGATELGLQAQQHQAYLERSKLEQEVLRNTLAQARTEQKMREANFKNQQSEMALRLISGTPGQAGKPQLFAQPGARIPFGMKATEQPHQPVQFFGAEGEPSFQVTPPNRGESRRSMAEVLQMQAAAKMAGTPPTFHAMGEQGGVMISPTGEAVRVPPMTAPEPPIAKEYRYMKENGGPQFANMTPGQYMSWKANLDPASNQAADFRRMQSGFNLDQQYTNNLQNVERMWQQKKQELNNAVNDMKVINKPTASDFEGLNQWLEEKKAALQRQYIINRKQLEGVPAITPEAASAELKRRGVTK